MSETTPKEPRRRRLAVSVRALMLLVLAIGLVLGWKINRAKTQKRAVALIEKAGGSVVHDYSFDGTHPYKNRESPPAPAWLRARLGDEFFQEVTSVSFYNPVTDDQIAPIADFDRLLAFELHRTHVTDAGLARLKSLNWLRQLHIEQKGLSIGEINSKEVRKIFQELDHLTYNQKVGEIMRRRGAAITDAGLAHLASLTSLQELTLLLPGITDAGLAHVGKLTDLRVLKLINTGVGDAGLVHLKGLNRLRELTITGEGVTDAGVASLAGLTGLRSLALWHTRITDAGLAHLERMDQLEVLDLQGSLDLTDRGLSALEKRKGLSELKLSETILTDAGMAHLAGLSGLETLDLTANEITDAGLCNSGACRDSAD